MKNLLVALALLILAVFAFVGYNSYSARRQANSDAVTPATGERPDPALPHASAAQTSATPSPAAPGEVTSSGAMTSGGMVPPASDSIQPDPPNGMTFGGSGHYQLYRQGNLTWRLDTETGQTCIVFATEEEWRKPQVFRAGCRGK